MNFPWKSQENPRKIPWKSHENRRKIPWKSKENPMKLKWVNYGGRPEIPTPGWWSRQLQGNQGGARVVNDYCSELGSYSNWSYLGFDPLRYRFLESWKIPKVTMVVSILSYGLIWMILGVASIWGNPRILGIITIHEIMGHPWKYC